MKYLSLSRRHAPAKLSLPVAGKRGQVFWDPAAKLGASAAVAVAAAAAVWPALVLSISKKAAAVPLNVEQTA